MWDVGELIKSPSMILHHRTVVICQNVVLCLKGILFLWNVITPNANLLKRKLSIQLYITPYSYIPYASLTLNT